MERCSRIECRWSWMTLWTSVCGVPQMEQEMVLMFRVDRMVILPSDSNSHWDVSIRPVVSCPSPPPSPVVSALQPDIIQQRLYKWGPAVTKETIRVKHHTCCAVTALIPPLLLLLLFNTLHLYFTFSSFYSSSTFSTPLSPRPPHAPLLFLFIFPILYHLVLLPVPLFFFLSCFTILHLFPSLLLLLLFFLCFNSSH